MKSTTNALVAVLLAAGFSAQAQAATVTEWNLSGQPGDQAFTAPSSAATHVTGANLVRGAGLTATAAANSISASGWNNQATDFFSFGFSVESGYQVDLSSLFIGTRSSNTGPGSLGLYYSGDSFAAPLHTFNQPGTDFVNSEVDLSALPNLTGSPEFRIFQIGTTAANGGATTSSAGTFRITDYFVASVETSNFKLTGEVSVVPVPAALPLMFSGLGVLSAFLRRRGAQA